MKNRIKDLIVTVVILTCMVGRGIYKENGWVALAALASLLITWIDILFKVYNSNKNLNAYQSVRCVAVLIVMFLGVIAVAAILAMNIVHRDEFLNEPVILDEITLISLLLCIIQESFVDIINLFIASAHK